PDDGRAVGRIADGAVVDLLDADLAEIRHTGDGRFDIWLQSFQILLEQFVLRVLVRAVDITDRRTFFVGPEQKPIVLFAHVPRGVGLPQHTQLASARFAELAYFGVRLGNDVLVFHGHHGNVEADHLARLAHEVAGRRNDVFASDVPVVGLDDPVAVPTYDPRDGRVAVDLGPTLARGTGECLGEIRRLDVPVLRMFDRADQTVDLDIGPAFPDFLRLEEIHLHADGLGHARVVAVLVHPIRLPRETDVGHLAEPGIHAGFVGEFLIEPDRVLVDLADRVAHVEQRQEPRGMPGRTRRELAPFDEHDVGPAFPRQVIERGYADDAAADHHHTRM